MANCQYGCEVMKGEVRCQCPSPGLQLAPDGRTCVGEWRQCLHISPQACDLMLPLLCQSDLCKASQTGVLFFFFFFVNVVLNFFRLPIKGKMFLAERGRHLGSENTIWKLRQKLSARRAEIHPTYLPTLLYLSLINFPRSSSSDPPLSALIMMAGAGWGS